MSDKNFMSYGDAESLFAELGSELGKRVEQYSTMPSASSTLLNKIVQYIGTTSESYANGLFYKCVYNEIEADYEWIKIDMGGGSGIAITATLLASGWDANNQQTIIFDGYSSSMNGVIGVPASATSAQKTAYTEAIINVINQSGSSFTFEATNVPSIDLPVVVYAGGGSGSGGTNVEPNPIGTPTDELVTIRIEDDIYSLAGGCEAIELTQTEYNELTEEEKSDPKKVYYITDAGGGGGGASALSELTDVELTDLADGEILKYDATEDKWVNAEDGGSGGGSVVALPSLYSTKEEMVGLWTDRKPLYQIALHFPSNMTLSPSAWSFISYSSSAIIDTIVTGFFTRGEQKGTNACRIGNQPANNRLLISPSSANNIDVTTNDYIVMQYTKTADTPVEDFNLQDFGIFAPVIYSLEEREIGVWTDGKPLYEKTFIIDNPNRASNISISDLSYDSCFVFDGYLSISGGSNLALNEDGRSWVHIYDNKIVWEYASSYTGLKLVITIRYTKTTDTPGSGSYAELGVPAVHYDDTERVIGTWFGETLYRKTWDFGSAITIASNTWTDTPISNANISGIISIKGHNLNRDKYTSWNALSASADSGNYVKIQQNRNDTISIRYLTLEYTKTS